MSLFNMSEEERRIRENERKRMAEEAVRADERSFRKFISNAKMYFFVGVCLVVVLAFYWTYLGMPTTLKELAKATGITKTHTANTTDR